MIVSSWTKRRRSPLEYGLEVWGPTLRRMSKTQQGLWDDDKEYWLR